MSIINNIFGGLKDDELPCALRLKVIRPVFESVAVNEKAESYLTGDPLTSSQAVFSMFRFLQEEAKEHFFALHLDSKNRLLCAEHVSSGSLNASIVHPREVFKSALLSSAAAMILVHNHPSGASSPSSEDIEISQRLKQGSELLGIRLLDHVIVGSDYYSFADQGQL